METRRAPPYRPFWVYHFFAFIDRLPIPGWLLCLLIILVVGVATHLVAWRQGNLIYGQINSYLATLGLFIVYIPFFWAFLAERSHRTLLDFLQGSGKSQAQVQAISKDFNSLPNWEVILLLALGILSGYFVYYTVSVPLMPISAQVLPSLSLLAWLTNMGFAFPLLARSLRQIALIKRLFNDLEMDIFNPQPIYAMSRYTSMISIILLFLLYGISPISFPALVFTPVGIPLQLLAVAPALSLFFIPLAEVNRTMRRAKERLLSELGKDLKEVQQRAHRSVASKKLANVSDLRNAVSMLKDEMDIVQKIRTLPWQTETLRNLLTPLLIPVFVYLVQRLLGGLLRLQ